MDENEEIQLWGKKINANYFLLIVIIIIVGWFIFTCYWGSEEIGSFGEKRNYITQYWVYLQPENAESKSYRVKADIKREIPDYYLLRVYWPNGGTSIFDDCNLDKEEYERNGYIHCFPLKGNSYEEKGYNIRIDEKVK